MLAIAYDKANRDSDALLVDSYADFLIRTHGAGAMDLAMRAVSLAPEWAPAHVTLAQAYARKNDVHHARTGRGAFR